MGSLILLAVFRYQREYIQIFIDSLTSMEAEHFFETTRDAGGSRVVEAFLNSNASGKIKRKLIVKLQGYFGELSMHPSCSFTVEKCFVVSSVSLREAIVSELLVIRTELSRTRQGPHLLRKLDVAGFAIKPDQWRSKQASRESALKKFNAVSGSNETKTSQKDIFLSETSKCTSDQNNLKIMREEIDQCLPAAAAATTTVQSMGSQSSTRELLGTKLSNSGLKRRSERKLFYFLIQKHNLYNLTAEFDVME